MPYTLFSDSTCDLTRELALEADVQIMPMSFQVSGKDYWDNFGEDISVADFYAQVRAGNMPKTALINTQRYLDTFTPCLEARNDVVYIAFSSALSGSCQCAMQAAEELNEQYAPRRVWVVDSLSASVGQGMLVYTAGNLRKGGMEAETLVTWLIDNRLSLLHWFTVDDINHLYRGGRVSKTAAVLGTALKIKPVLHVDNEGRLIPMEKVMGRKKSLSAMVKHIVDTIDRTKPINLFIGHGDSLEDAQICERQLREQLDVADVKIMPIGPVIGAHSGPGTIALFCFGNPR
ncbi:MAG: DegV family protein [Eubacteriales bacterium]|nr:DegV family protein [Eubacteriales bacterium]